MKRALVIITGPYQLLQALWYSAEHPDYELDALVKIANLNEDARDRLLRDCRSCGVFRRIIRTKGVDINTGLARKAGLMLRMTGSYLLGQRSRLTERIIRNEIGDAVYDCVLVDSELSILGGAFIDHADRDYDVTIMQEGLSDILERRDTPKAGLQELLYFWLARMGYCNPGICYKLEKTSCCGKLSSLSARMKYRPYRELIDLRGGTGAERFSALVEKTYDVDWELFRSADLILFTTFLASIGGGETQLEELHAWLRENYAGSRIVIKRHPRDEFSYSWEELDVRFLEAGVPAEVLLSQITRQKALFLFISTSAVDLYDRGVGYTILRFRSIRGSYYNEVFPRLREQLQIPEEHIVTIGGDA